ncbi:hypothetical protein EYF80_017379 [Liparis tanakae]|uniref:Uncharacterized protein n=1 Tax=Liparis tanakae TaxID=230148 RepID=A0A4Z2I5F4_9TELE|nr:hypothetical protein EYF80_017379 [Liparis tanakae]
MGTMKSKRRARGRPSVSLSVWFRMGQEMLDCSLPAPQRPGGPRGGISPPIRAKYTEAAPRAVAPGRDHRSMVPGIIALNTAGNATLADEHKKSNKLFLLRLQGYVECVPQMCLSEASKGQARERKQEVESITQGRAASSPILKRRLS